MAPVAADSAPSGQPDTTSPQAGGDDGGPSQGGNGFNGGRGSQPNGDLSTAKKSTLALGVGVGVGGAFLLIACIFMLVKIYKKRAQHRRAMAELDRNGPPVHSTPGVEIVEIPRPVSYARQGGLNPLHSKAGWGALSSDENVHNSPSNGERLSQLFSLGGSNKKRKSVGLPRRARQKGMPLRRIKHLSRITESPRSRVERSPSPTGQEPVINVQDTPMSIRTAKSMSHSVPEDGDVFVCPGSPKAETVPSFAIGMAKLRQTPAAAAGIAGAGTKAVRSKSVGTGLGEIPDNAVFVDSARLSRPSMHARSFSWGAQAMSRPPSGPVPPLPVIAPHEIIVEYTSRQGVCVRRGSATSSREFADSSVIVSSPILTMRKARATASPSVEQLVAEDEGAQLKTVDLQYQGSPILSAVQLVPGARRDVAHRSAMAQYSDDSRASLRLSSASTVSSILSNHNRLSIPQVGTADRVSFSRVSSTGSLGSSPGITKFASTPIRKPSRPTSTTVSIDGSPAQRMKKKHVLRDISGNAMRTPSRQQSNSTQSSARSSNGNPFQWDGPMQICRQPSALKGSPNARKGHRRQNCVRISTLTPQILGPPPSRPTSPSLMDGIEEESTDGEEAGSQKRSIGFTSNAKGASMPSSTSVFAPNVKSLRASLTPSSPTLSTWTAYQEPHALPSHPSEGTLSVPSPNKSKRYSDRSSNFSIPSFPSPSKATMTKVLDGQPVPEFYLSRPSSDTCHLSNKENIASSPPAFAEHSWHREHQDTIPSSPPIPQNASGSRLYDPAWPIVTIPAPDAGNEYDPASPDLAYSSPSQYPSSPPTLPFANALSPESGISPRSRPVSQVGGDMPDTPPCSPKTMPAGFEDFFQKKRVSATPRKHPKRPPVTGSKAAHEKLTSSNASAIMAQLPPPKMPIVASKNSLEAFPGAPILPPPTESPLSPPPKSAARDTPIARTQRALSISLSQQQIYLQPLRDAPPTPIPSPSVRIPSPLYIPPKQTQPQQPQSPRGPRSEPAKSVLKNAMALRRMNSEIDCVTRSSSPDTPSHRGSNRYIRLGREASPLLPFIASPQEHDNNGNADLFDFEFGSTLSAHAEAGANGSEEGDSDLEAQTPRREVVSALDDIDLPALERDIAGALKGFEVPVDDHHPEELLPTVPEERSSSVWEDGERYWEWLELKKRRGSRVSFAGGEGLVTPTQEREEMSFTLAGAGTLGRGSGSVGRGFLTPAEKRLRGMSSPVGATPRSLYDADGFLRG